MRFMMLMIPKGYEQAEPGTLPPAHEGSGYGWPLIIRLSREIHIERRRTGGKTVTVLVPLT